MLYFGFFFNFAIYKRKKFNMSKLKQKNSEVTLSNILLLIFTFILIFMIPLFPETVRRISNNILFSAIFFLAIFSIKSRVRKRMFIVAVIAFVTEWIAEIFKMNVLVYISSLTNVVFFQIIVIRLIIQIARSKKVNTGVILESVNAYLLLGLMFTMLVAILHLYNADALNFANKDEVGFQHFIYYTFVTLSTLGYGDITPQSPVGKSLSILISVSGQLYLAIIIAMLVGKFAASNSGSKKS